MREPSSSHTRLKDIMNDFIWYRRMIFVESNVSLLADSSWKTLKCVEFLIQ